MENITLDPATIDPDGFTVATVSGLDSAPGETYEIDVVRRDTGQVRASAVLTERRPGTVSTEFGDLESDYFVRAPLGLNIVQTADDTFEISFP